MAEASGSVWSVIDKFINGLSKVTGFVGALAIMAAALIVCEGVFVRKVLNLSTVWQIEMSVFLLMYACFVGAAYAQRGEHHLNVDLVIIHMSPKWRETVLLITAVFSCLICGLVAWYSWPMWWEAFVNGDHTETLWGPPLWIPYFFLPLGMSLLFLQYISMIVDKFKKLKQGQVSEDVVRQELKDIDIPAGSGQGVDHG